MKRSSLVRGTGLIMIFAVVCTIVIFSVAFFKVKKTGRSEDSSAQTHQYNWYDSLSNEKSDYAPLANLDGDMLRFMGKWNIEGVSFAVTRNDSLLYAKGYGWADKEAGAAMGPDNVMRIASASKLVTAVAVMKLIESGKISMHSKVFGPTGILNDSIYTNAIRDPRLFDITVDHLLRHRAGFGLGAGDPMFTTAELVKARCLPGPPDSRQLAALVLGRRIIASPGSSYKYSNFGYLLLSLVIEKVSGKDYWDFVEKEVLEPAGCFGFQPATNYYAERGPREVRYYVSDSSLVPEFNGSGRLVSRVYGANNIRGLMGGGGWCASAAGLARLVASIDKYPHVKNILSDASVDSLTQWNEDENMARGWSHVTDDGIWKRTGTLASTHTLVEHFPDGECWVMITNTGVWTGFHFADDMSRLVKSLRSRYSSSMPARDLFLPQK